MVLLFLSVPYHLGLDHPNKCRLKVTSPLTKFGRYKKSDDGRIIHSTNGMNSPVMVRKVQETKRPLMVRKVQGTKISIVEIVCRVKFCLGTVSKLTQLNHMCKIVTLKVAVPIFVNNNVRKSTIYTENA